MREHPPRHILPEESRSVRIGLSSLQVHDLSLALGTPACCWKPPGVTRVDPTDDNAGTQLFNVKGWVEAAPDGSKLPVALIRFIQKLGAGLSFRHRKVTR